MEETIIVLDDLEHFERHRDCEYCRWIRVEEVKHAIIKMSRGKMIIPDKSLVEFWKSLD